MDREHVESVVIADLRRANAYFEETVEPILLERRDVYLASKQFYEKKFPELSKKTDYRSFDFYAYVQWAKAPILDAFFGTSKVVHIVGCGPEDGRAAELMEKLVNWQTTQQSAGYQVCSTWVEDGLIYEFGVMKLWWERATGRREFEEVFPMEQYAQLTQDPDVEIKSVGEPDYFGDVPVTFSKEFLLKNRARFDNVSPFDMRWSPEAKTLDTANFVAQRQFVSASSLIRDAEAFGYDMSAVEDVVDEGGNVSTTTSDAILNPELDNIGEEEEKARRLVELYECYVNIDVDGDGVLEPVIVTVANEKVLRVAPNTFERAPFFQLTTHKDSAKVFPTDISMADITGELQHLRTAMVRQLEVNLSLSNRPRFFVDEMRVNMDDFLSDRMCIRCKDSPQQIIQPQPTTQIASWTVPFFELTKSFEEEWTGRTRYNQGTQADTFNKTATGINLIMKASTQRVNSIEKNYAETGYKPMLKFLVFLNQRYMDQKQMMRVFREPLEVAPDDIHGDLDVIVEADVGLEKQQREINALTQYLKEAFPFAMQLGLAGPENFRDACVRAMELSGLTGAAQYFKTPEQVQAEAQQRQVMALAGAANAGAAVGGGGPGGPGGGVPGMVQ